MAKKKIRYNWSGYDWTTVALGTVGLGISLTGDFKNHSVNNIDSSLVQFGENNGSMEIANQLAGKGEKHQSCYSQSTSEQEPVQHHDHSVQITNFDAASFQTCLEDMKIDATENANNWNNSSAMDCIPVVFLAAAAGALVLGRLKNRGIKKPLSSLKDKIFKP